MVASIPIHGSNGWHGWDGSNDSNDSSGLNGWNGSNGSNEATPRAHTTLHMTTLAICPSAVSIRLVLGCRAIYLEFISEMIFIYRSFVHRSFVCSFVRS